MRKLIRITKTSRYEFHLEENEIVTEYTIKSTNKTSLILKCAKRGCQKTAKIWCGQIRTVSTFYSKRRNWKLDDAEIGITNVAKWGEVVDHGVNGHKCNLAVENDIFNCAFIEDVDQLESSVKSIKLTNDWIPSHHYHYDNGVTIEEVQSEDDDSFFIKNSQTSLCKYEYSVK